MSTQVLSSIEIASDLLRIHKKRISKYMQVLHESGHLEGDLKAIFERIIEESTKCRNELVENMPAEGIQPAGKIYEIGVGPNADITKDRKTILIRCSDDELAIINAYSTALSSGNIDRKLKEVLTSQLQDMQQLYKHIISYHDAQ